MEEALLCPPQRTTEPCFYLGVLRLPLSWGSGAREIWDQKGRQSSQTQVLGPGILGRFSKGSPEEPLPSIKLWIDPLTRKEGRADAYEAEEKVELSGRLGSQ